MQGRISCIVIEDEPLAMDRTVGYIRKLTTLSLLSTFDNAPDAMAFLKKNQVDLIFLDINLGEISGIQLLECLRINVNVILTTAYPDFALKGYELNVTDYLLKPFTFERFLQAVNKVSHGTLQKEMPVDKIYFFVKTENRLEKIFYNDLLYIEGMRDYRKIHTTQKKIMTLQTFNDFEKEIPPHIVCRVHKSYMVAINKINIVEKGAVYIQENIIPVSETYKAAFYKIIGR